MTVRGFRCLTAERLILESPQFKFTVAETENAIDSSIRLRLVAEQRLRTRVIAEHRSGLNGSRLLLDALVDTGGESRLERWLLRLVREAGIGRPMLQKTYRDGTRVIARSMPTSGRFGRRSLRSRYTRLAPPTQMDAQRRTELTLRGLRVVTFTYEDIRDRPAWVIGRLRQALATAA